MKSVKALSSFNPEREYSGPDNLGGEVNLPRNVEENLINIVENTAELPRPGSKSEKGTENPSSKPWAVNLDCSINFGVT